MSASTIIQPEQPDAVVIGYGSLVTAQGSLGMRLVRGLALRGGYLMGSRQLAAIENP